MSSILFEGLAEAKKGFFAVRAADAPWEDYTTFILASFVLHSVLFFILPASPWLPKKGETPASHKGPKPYDRFGESVKIRNGHVSSFHATVAVVSVIIWLCNYKFELWNYQRNLQGGIATPGNANGDMWYARLTSFTAGYFLYDTICMAYYNRYLGNVGSYIHHIVIGLALIPGIYIGVGSPYHFIYLMEEMSTPALNLKNLYRDSPRGYKFWSIVFVLTFVGSRGLYGLTGAPTTYYCLYHYWMAHRAEYNSWYFEFLCWQQFFGFTVSRILNIYWMSLIAKYLIKPKKKDAKKVQ